MMNKRTKGALYTALILAGVGLILWVVGMIAGGANASAVRIDFSNGLSGMVSGLMENPNQEYRDITQEYDEKITKLDFDLSYGEITIKEGEKFSIDAKNVWGDFQTYVEDGVWHIRARQNGVYISLSWFSWNWSDKSKVVITIPKGYTFDEAIIHADMGSISIEAVAADEIDLFVAMGKIKLKKFEAKNVTAECDMGGIELAGEVNSNINLTTGMGDIAFKGVVYGDISADCDMGSIELTLDNQEEDFRYEVDCDMGTVKIGGHKYGRSASFFGSDSAKYRMNLECGMGSCTVKFK